MKRRIVTGAIALTLALLLGAPPAFAQRERSAVPRPAQQGVSGNGPGQPRVEGSRAQRRFDVVLGLDRRQRELQRFARRVSYPGSPRYGRYLSPRQAGLRFGATRATVRAVRRFLRRRGIRSRPDITRSFVEALAPARRARRLFGSPDGRKRVPAPLRGKVREVLVDDASQDQFLPRARRAGVAADPLPRADDGDERLEPPYVRTGTPAGCPQGRNATASYEPDGPPAGPAFTPNQLQRAYGAAPLHYSGVTGRRVRVAIYGADGFGRRELGPFARCFGLEIPTTRLVKVGTRSAGRTGGEAALDPQMVTAMAPGIRSLTVYSIGSQLWPAGFSAMLDRRNAPDQRPPHVISVSQGNCEGARLGLGLREVRLTEHVLAAAAASGITVAAGSGDNGSFCPDGPNRGFYPSASRWAISVGGTSLTLDEENRIVDEIPWNNRSFAPRLGLGGGGGFGRLLRRPAFQRDLGAWGNHRGYPDVALIADAYPGIAFHCNLNRESICDPSEPGNPFRAGFGTSAATPLFAGIVALANQRLLAAGRPPLGFVNPLLYRLGRSGGGQGALRDIVEGSNEVFWQGCCRAFPGYDRASGWGSVNAERLAEIVLRRGPR